MQRLLIPFLSVVGFATSVGAQPAPDAQPPPPAPSPTDPPPTVAAGTAGQPEASAGKMGGDSPAGSEAPKAGSEQAPNPDGAMKPKEEAEAKLGPPPPLTWHGVTLSGTVDVGLAHLTHGAPISPTYGPSLPFVLQNYSNRPITSVANNGLSQSKIGLAGVESLGVLDLKGLFKLDTGFQPASGRLTDGPKSLVDNNGLAAAKKISSGDSGRAGQAINGVAYVGLGSKMLGTLTFGRQNTLMADDLLKYDPQLQSQAFSPIGYSGTSGGFGDTEDKTLDDSIKYTFGYGPVRVAGFLQLGKPHFLPEGAYAVDVGADFAGLSVDAVYGKTLGEVAAASLSATQVMTAAPGTLAGTISDNTGFAIMASYDAKPVKLYGGYEYMKFENPKDTIPAGAVTIGGYVLSVVNNTAYNIAKTLQYAWGGVRYSASPRLEITGAYYHFIQNSFNSTPTGMGCSDNSATSCSGTFEDASLVVDYRLSSRFDTYAGVNYTHAADGLASGFLNTDDVATMVGVRFNF